MKRRTFIRMVGASALGLPFVHRQLKPASWTSATEIVEDNRRIPLPLEFSRDEAGVLAVLRNRSRAVCLLGGGVLNKAGRKPLPYVNLMTDSTEFGAIKKELFALGVQPISTPELPSHFIKFVHNGIPFSVLNMEREAFLRQNRLGRELHLLPLAHNFLVYSVDGEWVMDRYGALECRSPRRKRYRIKRLLEPENTVAGLELCLAVAFDTALLNVDPPVGHPAFEKRLLAATVDEKREATVVFHQILSFFPDLLELAGWDSARPYLVSPLCRSAAAHGPGIDLKQVDLALRRVEKRGLEVSSSHLMLAINDEFQKLGATRGVGVGLPDYMAAKKLPIRRGDLLAEVLRSTATATA